MPKDQTFCPKCGRMYCEGYWGEGVCVADMFFSDEPTARGDDVAGYLRIWYEANRESWLDRHQINPFGRSTDRSGVHADGFILSLINEIRRIDAAASEQKDLGK